MKAKPEERKHFYFTATYMPVEPVRDMTHWAELVESKKQQHAAAIEANRPMGHLSPEDHEFLVNMGVNGFHMHGWRPGADTAIELLDKGFLIFSYQDDFYFLDTGRHEGQEHIAACRPHISCRELAHSQSFSGQVETRGPVDPSSL